MEFNQGHLRDHKISRRQNASCGECLSELGIDNYTIYCPSHTGSDWFIPFDVDTHLDHPEIQFQSPSSQFFKTCKTQAYQFFKPMSEGLFLHQHFIQAASRSKLNVSKAPSVKVTPDGPYFNNFISRESIKSFSYSIFTKSSKHSDTENPEDPINLVIFFNSKSPIEFNPGLQEDLAELSIDIYDYYISIKKEHLTFHNFSSKPILSEHNYHIENILSSTSGQVSSLFSRHIESVSDYFQESSGSPPDIAVYKLRPAKNGEYNLLTSYISKNFSNSSKFNEFTLKKLAHIASDCGHAIVVDNNHPNVGDLLTNDLFKETSTFACLTMRFSGRCVGIICMRVPGPNSISPHDILYLRLTSSLIGSSLLRESQNLIYNKISNITESLGSPKPNPEGHSSLDLLE